MPLHPQVRNLYKTLLYIGRDYPAGYTYFRTKLKSAFMKNKSLSTESEIQSAIHRGEFVMKELEALWFLKKYRTMRERYGDSREIETMEEFEERITK